MRTDHTFRQANLTAAVPQRSSVVESPSVKSEYGKIVVRYADGRLIKGYSHDFYPNKPVFHLFPAVGASHGEGSEVRVKDLKAVFFVRDFAGNPAYNERKRFAEGEQPAGRKVQVTFRDGEVLVGSTLGYHRRNPGFFFVPVDPQSNNAKVFAIASAVTNVRFL